MSLKNDGKCFLFHAKAVFALQSFNFFYILYAHFSVLYSIVGVDEDNEFKIS